MNKIKDKFILAMGLVVIPTICLVVGGVILIKDYKMIDKSEDREEA